MTLGAQAQPFFSGTSLEPSGGNVHWPFVWVTILAGLMLLGTGLYLILRWSQPVTPKSMGFSQFKIPEQVGSYLIDRILGHGAFATTYLAYHAVTRRRVALKILHPFRQSDPEFVARFLQEAELGAKLKHPNLVRILDTVADPPETMKAILGPFEKISETKTRITGNSSQKDNYVPDLQALLPSLHEPIWLALEYIHGQRLDKEMGQQPMPIPEVLRIALGIAQGLAYAHANKVIHRDIKPSNVILAGRAVKVMDFGVARVQGSEALTATYTFLGTPLYAAPEMQMGTDVGPEVDLYSLGIVMFEMLTGKPPFAGGTPFETIHMHQKAPLPSLAELRPETPKALIALLESMCAKDPGDRPCDEEVIRLLKELMD